MSNKPISIGAKKTNFRWVMCALLFVATTSTIWTSGLVASWKDFIAEDFHWTDSQYGTITGVFSIACYHAFLRASLLCGTKDTSGPYSSGQWAHVFMRPAASYALNSMINQLSGLSRPEAPCFGRIDKFGGDVYFLPYGSGYRRIR